MKYFDFQVPDLNKISDLALFQRFNLFVFELKSMLTDEFSIRIKKYGRFQSLLLDINLNHIKMNSQGYLLYKFHDFEHLKRLKNKMDYDLNYKVFIICHRFYDLKKLMSEIEQVQPDSARLVFLVSPNPLDNHLYSENEIKNISSYTKYCDFLFPIKNAKSKQTESLEKKTLKRSESETFEKMFFNYAVIQFGKYVLDPKQFFYQIFDLKFNKRTILFYRLIELFLFIHYCGYMFFLKTISFFKSILTFLFYRLRHLFLMSGFKSFGLIVDLFYKIKAIMIHSFDIQKIILIRAYYSIRHIVLMVYFKSYGICVDSYYLILRGLSYLKWHFLSNARDKFYICMVRLYYQVKHIVMMSFIRLYYSIRKLILVLFYKTIHVVKKYLLFPFFKTYWFLSYQYKKRIKKEIH